MLTIVIMMITNWLHFGYSGSDMQGENSAPAGAAVTGKLTGIPTLAPYAYIGL